MKRWTQALKKFVMSKQEQMAAIRGLERCCIRDNLFFEPLFQIALQFSYDQEIVFEEAILEWEKNIRSTITSGPELVLLERAKIFLTWLKEAEEEEEED